jgi:hypothetical protein
VGGIMRKEFIWLFIKEIEEWDVYDLIDISTFFVTCQNCLEINVWEDWIENWISLDEEEFGAVAKHIRAECPNCNELYDHKDKATLDFGVS